MDAAEIGIRARTDRPWQGTVHSFQVFVQGAEAGSPGSSSVSSLLPGDLLDPAARLLGVDGGQ